MNQDPFSDFLSQKANDFQPVPRTSFAEVERRMKQRRRRKLAYWSAAAALFLGLGSWLMLQLNPSEPLNKQVSSQLSAVSSSNASTARKDSSLPSTRNQTITEANVSDRSQNAVKQPIPSTRNQTITEANVSDRSQNAVKQPIPSTRNQTLTEANVSDRSQNAVKQPIPSTRNQTITEANVTGSKKKLKKRRFPSTGNKEMALATSGINGEFNQVPTKDTAANEMLTHSSIKSASVDSIKPGKSSISEPKPEAQPQVAAQISDSTHPDDTLVTASVDPPGRAKPHRFNTVFESVKPISPLVKERGIWNLTFGHSLFLAWNARNLNNSVFLYERLKDKLEGIADADAALGGQVYQITVSRKLLGGLRIATGIAYAQLDFLRINQPQFLPSGTGVSLTTGPALMHLDMQLQQIEVPLMLQWEQLYGRWGWGVSAGSALNYTLASQQYHYNLSTSSTELRTVAPDSTVQRMVGYGLLKVQAHWEFLPNWQLRLGPGVRLAFHRQYAANDAFRFLTLESGLTYKF